MTSRRGRPPAARSGRAPRARRRGRRRLPHRARLAPGRLPRRLVVLHAVGRRHRVRAAARGERGRAASRCARFFSPPGPAPLPGGVDRARRRRRHPGHVDGALDHVAVPTSSRRGCRSPTGTSSSTARRTATCSTDRRRCCTSGAWPSRSSSTSSSASSRRSWPSGHRRPARAFGDHRRRGRRHLLRVAARASVSGSTACTTGPTRGPARCFVGLVIAALIAAPHRRLRLLDRATADRRPRHGRSWRRWRPRGSSCPPAPRR